MRDPHGQVKLQIATPLHTMIRQDLSTMGGFPLLIQPESGNAGASTLIAWLKEQNVEFVQLLRHHGAILFRGFAIQDANTFEAICRAGTPNLLGYTGGGSPRSLVSGKVYTSTEYAADQHIPLHCEESYFPELPHYIWFFCEKQPLSAGQTPIGDMQSILEKLDPELVKRFHERGVRYIYNLHGGNGFGRGWKEAFETNDRSQVEAWLDANHANYHWNDDNSLHMDLQGPGLRTHTETGVLTWGNQAVNWHTSSLPPGMAKMMYRIYKSEDRFPKHAVFADGSPIPDEDIHHILDKLAESEIIFDWQNGDILLCDNQRVAHGRHPFSGERRILVALA